MPCASAALKSLCALNPSQVEVFINDLSYADPCPSRKSRLSGKGKGLQLLFVMPLDSISGQLLGELLDVSLPLLVILRLGISSVEI